MTYQPPNSPHRWNVPRPSALSRLSPGKRVAVILGAPLLGLVLLCCGGLTVVGALTGEPPQTRPASEDQQAAQAPAEQSTEATEAAEATEPAEPTPSPTPQPVVETRTVTETVAIPFARKTVKDSSLPEGTRKVRTRGVAGTKTVTYEVTYADGVETGRKAVREEVTKKPVTEVTAVGTKQTRKCDPNYTGCVPIASDVDCAGGSGNGPAYVQGPVKVIGEDIYDLDRDGDGIACDT